MKALVKKTVEFRPWPEENVTEMVEVKVGDWVCFKADIEQHGQIVEIKMRNDHYLVPRLHSATQAELVLENVDGFPGDYLRYQTRTTVRADDCWL